MKVEAIKYAAVGVINTIIDYIAFVALYYGLSISLIPANTIAFLVAVTQSYFINKNWTFSKSLKPKSVTRQAFAYLIVNSVGLLLSNITIFYLSNFVHVIIAKVSATVVVFVWGFSMSKLFIFKTDQGNS